MARLSRIATALVVPAALALAAGCSAGGTSSGDGASAAERTLSTAARQSLYNTIQADAASDAFLAFLYYSPFAYATTTGVHGFAVTPLGNYHLENVWLSGTS